MKLQKRERLALYVGIPIIAITLVYRFTIAGRLENLSVLSESVPDRHNDLRKAGMIRDKLMRRRANAEALREKIGKRGTAFDAPVLLISLAQRAKLNDRHTITQQNLRDSESSEFTPKGWKVSLEGVTQVEIGEFLRQVYEIDQLLHISEFTITPEKKVDGLHAEISIVTLFNK